MRTDQRWLWLDHPLLGRRRGLTAFGLGYALLTLLATGLLAVLYAGGVDLLPWWSIRLVDGFAAAVIIAAVLSATVLPAAYGVLNGGPVMAAVIGVIPFASGSLVYLEYTLTNDLVVALISSSLGAVVAVASTWIIRARSTGERAPLDGEFDGLLVASGITVIAIGATWRFDRGAPGDTVATIDPFYWLVIIPALGCAVLWVRFVTLSR